VTPRTLVAALTATAGVSSALVDAVAVKLLRGPSYLHHGVPTEALRILLRGTDLPGGQMPVSTFTAVKRLLQSVRDASAGLLLREGSRGIT
jgi:hypothetical protein